MGQGNYNNTIFQDGKLQLIKLGIDENNQVIYADSGFWESAPILIQDKITAFKNVAKSIVTPTGDGSYKIYVRTSENGSTWGGYIEINEDGSINNPPAKYAMIKIEITAGRDNVSLLIDDFEQEGKYLNEFIESEEGYLKLKKNYELPMSVVSQDEEGVIFSRTIENSTFLKIDSIGFLFE